GAATGMIAVIKADAYGHGAVRVARAALSAGAEWLAVATIQEAAEIPVAGIVAPILVLGPVGPGDEGQAVALGARLSVHEPGSLSRISGAARGARIRPRLHLKVDTGMGRLGCSPDEAVLLARRVHEDPNLELEGLWTHFAEADDPGSPRTQEQLRAFLGVVSDLASSGISPPVLHCANSAAALLFPSTRLAMVRVGLPIYGYAPTPALLEGLNLRPVLSWKSRVVAIHALDAGDRVGYGGTFRASAPRRTATVSTGYADGYPRALSNRGEVLVGGVRAPVIGRISMDYLTIDVTDAGDVGVGDEVVIIGRQGGHAITADDLARQLQTISWEVLTMIGRRVERVDVDD
ncbi:MAG: alanine racemase, partial [Candidatus Dormibacteraeota bacterium]|nr:alanine racemase [Candidatus Dormibacteraeota bacterium]